MPTIEPRSLHPPPQALSTLTALVTLVSCRFRAYLTYLTCLPPASEVLFCFPGGCSWAFWLFTWPPLLCTWPPRFLTNCFLTTNSLSGPSPSH